MSLELLLEILQANRQPGGGARILAPNQNMHFPAAVDEPYKHRFRLWNLELHSELAHPGVPCGWL
jgi:hypothetical protein